MICLSQGRAPAISLASFESPPSFSTAGLSHSVALVIALEVSTAELGSPLNRVLAFGVALFSSTLILGLTCDRSATHPVSRLLGSRVIVYLGSISYPFFLIQLTEPCQWLYWILLGPVENRILRAILLYIISTPIAALLYVLVERPTQRWLSARLKTT